MKDFGCGIYFDTRRAKANGQYPIFLKLYREKKNIYIDSGFSSAKDGFDGERFVGGSDMVSRLNMELRNIYDKFRLWCMDFDDTGMDNKGVKKMADAFISKYRSKRGYEDKSYISLIECWDEYVRNCVHSVGNERIFNNTEKYIVRYDKTVTLRDVDPAWLRAFENHLIKKDLAVNTRAMILRNVRTVILYAISCEYCVRNPFKIFKIKEEATPMRALTKDEIIKLRDHPCNNEVERYSRDIWMLSFYLFGINPVDLYGLKKIVHGRIQYRRGKTHQLYDIAVPPEAMEIIERYKGKDSLIGDCCCHGPHRDYRVTNAMINRALQHIGITQRGCRPSEGEALFPKLTMYWARYSAASLMAELDIPMETISRCLGHSSGLRVTQIYVKFNQKKIDEAQRKMIDALK